MTKNTPTLYFEVLVALFITTLIVSNIASIKLTHVGGLVFDAGTLLFPLAYIVGDVITEVYGFRRMRRLIGIGLVMLLITTATFWIVGMLSPASDWTNQGAYDSILGVVWRIALASGIAIAVGELLNAYVLAKLKIATKGRGLWGRLIGSSAIGNLADTAVFTTIAFAGTVSASVLLNIIGTVYLLKMVIEIAASPVSIAVIKWLKKREQLDVFEEPHLLHD